eukprot:365808-Chlamydomonas_euryale.AAC.5
MHVSSTWTAEGNQPGVITITNAGSRPGGGRSTRKGQASKATRWRRGWAERRVSGWNNIEGVGLEQYRQCRAGTMQRVSGWNKGAGKTQEAEESEQGGWARVSGEGAAECTETLRL